MIVKKILFGSIPYATTFIFIAFLVFASRVPGFDSLHKELLLVLPLPAMFFVLAGAIYFLLPERSVRGVAHHLSSTFLSVFGGYGLFLLLGGVQYQWLLAGAVSMLLVIYLQRIPRSFEVGPHHEEFVHFSHAYHLFSAFLLLAFAFGVTHLLQVPVWILAIGIGLSIGLLFAESLRRAGANASDVRLVFIVFSVMVGEVYAALSSLPTMYIVNAAVLTILLTFVLKICLSVMAQVGGLQNLRRQTVLSFILIGVILFTSRWT